MTSPIMKMYLNGSLTAEMLQKFREDVERTRIKTIIPRTVEGEERHFLVSTCNTFDHGWETMVFPCKADGAVSDWGDLYTQRYATQEEAKIGHQQTVETWEVDPSRLKFWQEYDENRGVEKV
jgi:hypothetical protein